MATDILSSSRFKPQSDELDGIAFRYWVPAEASGKPPLLLLHGSGPGASTHGNWRLVLEHLLPHFHVVATDLIGFGQSGRKPKAPYFDYELWVRQARRLLDQFGQQPVNVLGHSLAGSLALKLAAIDKRVQRVMTTGSLGARFPSNPALETVWSFPQTTADLVFAGQTLVYDKALIDDAYVEGRRKILYVGDYKDYFQQMFAGDKQRYIDAAVLSTEDLEAIRCPVLLVHGRNDVPTPPIASRELAQRLPQADLVEIAHCGHSVALEHPRKLASLARSFFTEW